MTQTDADTAAAPSAARGTTFTNPPSNVASAVWTPPVGDSFLSYDDASARPVSARRTTFVCYLECNDARRERTAAALAASGHWVCSVSQEAEALRALATTPFDVFLIGMSGPCSRTLIESLRCSPLAHVKAVRVACVALARVDAQSLYKIGVDKVLSFYLEDAQLGSEILAMTKEATASVEAEIQEHADASWNAVRGRPRAAAAITSRGCMRPASVMDWDGISRVPMDSSDEYELQLAWCQALLAAAAVQHEHDRLAFTLPALEPQSKSSKGVPVPAARYIDVEHVRTPKPRTAALQRMVSQLIRGVRGVFGGISARWCSAPVKIAVLFLVLVLATLWHHVF